MSLRFAPKFTVNVASANMFCAASPLRAFGVCPLPRLVVVPSESAGCSVTARLSCLRSQVLLAPIRPCSLARFRCARDSSGLRLVCSCGLEGLSCAVLLLV